MEDETPELNEQSNVGIQKPKKPRSQKQIECFAKARQTRIEKAQMKNEKIKEIKETIKDTPLPKLKEKINPKVKEDEKEEEEVVVGCRATQPLTEVETVYVKRSKPKPKKKVIVVEESDSESETEEVVYKRKPKQKQQNDIHLDVHSRGECPRHAGVPPPTPPVPQLYFF